MSEETLLLGGEYVLGTLGEDERLRVLVRLIRDADLRRDVAFWERSLEPLGDGVPEEAPAPQVWRAIERSLSISGAMGGAAATPDIAATAAGTPSATSAGSPTDAGATVVPITSARRTAGPPASRNLNIWRGIAVGMTAVAASLAGLLVYERVASPGGAPTAAGERYVAAVNRDGGQPALIVSVDTGSGEVVVRSVTAEPPSDRSYEVWFIADDAGTPRSLGTLESDRDAASLSRAISTLGAAPRGTIAISEEPPGGSTTDAPTGPVVFTGRLVRAD